MSAIKRPNPDVRRRDIIALAEVLLRQENAEQLGVDLVQIAESRGILVQAKPDTAAGVSGMLCRVGDSFGILYATHIKSIGFQRFSIAHELGHYFLPGHPEHLLSGGVHESRSEFRSADAYEREADYFASGLLMPSKPFKQALSGMDEGLEAIIALAERCKTSLTATAIRYADLTTAAVAVVASQGGRIEYAFASEVMKRRVKDMSWPRKGTAVPEGATARLNRDPAAVARGVQLSDGTDLSNWLGGRSLDGIEEAIGLGAFGRVLTVLTCSEERDDRFGEEEDEDELLEKSWTPRFR
jgi:Zn-dependent peptidase ImmA (M78 family)